MPGYPHEFASELFSRELILQLNQLGCVDEIIPHGQETIRLGNVEKEPDKSWGPEDSDHITCVLELAVSESRFRTANMS